MQLVMLHSPTCFPCLGQLSIIGLILSPQYLLSGSIECLSIDPGSFTGYKYAIGYFLLSNSHYSRIKTIGDFNLDHSLNPYFQLNRKLWILLAC